MYCIDVRQLKDHIKPNETVITIKAGNQVQKISLEYQKVGYGERRFFRCPHCSKRVEHLYFNGELWRCAKCHGINLYHGIQNKTKGSYDEIAYRMKRYAEKNKIQINIPFNYIEYAQDKKIKRSKYRQHLKVLQALENMRFHALFFGQTYKPKVIRSVISGQHPIMQHITMAELKDNIYDWNTGIRIDLSNQQMMCLIRK